MTMPDVRAEIAFVRDGAGWPLWRDVSADVEWWQGVRISRRRSHELDEVQPGTMSLTLTNTDGRYTAGNTASPYYPNVRINRPIRIRARWPSSINRLLKGQAEATNAALFSTNNGTLATSATAPAGQTSSIRWSSASWASGDIMRLGVNSTATPTEEALEVTPGATYAVSCQARRETNAVSAAIRVRWFTADGAFISDVFGSTVTLTTSFQPVTFVGAAPANAVFARVFLTTQSAATSAAILSSAWQFEQAASPSSWVSPGIEYMRFVGYVDRWPHSWDNGVLGRVSITATDRQKLFSRQLLGSTPLTDNQLSGARAAALLTAAGVTTMTVDPGVSTLGLSGNEATQNIQQLLRTTATSEAGLFFVGRDGVPVFQDRSKRQRPSTVVLTVNADQCGPDLHFVVDDALLINDATVLADNGSSATATDSASITEYGRYSRRMDTVLVPGEITDRAAYLLFRYKEPAPRAGQISIEARSQPALWPALLGSEIGQRIQVTNLPSNAPSGTLDLWIEGVQDFITDETWTFTFDPSPASTTVAFILDDPTYGLLDFNVLGW
ncbi:hypothetical protein [Thermoactinospora rubra]|uniref:hypothetical protein n=1 Tax=Thermoactinospora rubra TaxID=1088767 RepID=UPI0011806992|nr:hypothetical protein [Thermoactinospora rubra]